MHLPARDPIGVRIGVRLRSKLCLLALPCAGRERQAGNQLCTHLDRIVCVMSRRKLPAAGEMIGHRERRSLATPLQLEQPVQQFAPEWADHADISW